MQTLYHLRSASSVAMYPLRERTPPRQESTRRSEEPWTAAAWRWILGGRAPAQRVSSCRSVSLVLAAVHAVLVLKRARGFL
uniref:Uncharacterized protein n=1 Tax=Knipowitschia caucasica TaxID=637954 RepID=A0AAV2LXM8_KNICA